MTGKTFAGQINKINIRTNRTCWDFTVRSSRVFLDYLCMCCKPSNSVKARCIHYKVDFSNPSCTVWSLGCHNDSLVLLVFFEDIHIRTGSLSVFWVTQSSSWHPKERLDLTRIMLSFGVPATVTTRAVLGLAECSLAWHWSDWHFHQYWILMNGSYRSSAHQRWWSLSKTLCSSIPIQRWLKGRTFTNTRLFRKLAPSLKPIELQHNSCCDHISKWQRTRSRYNNSSIKCLMFSHFHTVLL